MVKNLKFHNPIGSDSVLQYYFLWNFGTENQNSLKEPGRVIMEYLHL